MRTVPALMAGMALLLAACGGADTPGQADGGGEPPAMEAPGEVRGVVDWREQRADVELPNGWRVAFCEGDAPVLCVTDQGRHLGTVDLGRYPAEAGLTLDERIEDYLRNLERYRTEACQDHTFIAAPTAQAVVGGQAGRQYASTASP